MEKSTQAIEPNLIQQSKNTSIIEVSALPEFCNESKDDSVRRNFLPQSKLKSVGTVSDFKDISTTQIGKTEHNSRRNCSSLSPNTRRTVHNTNDGTTIESINLPILPQNYVLKAGSGYNQTKAINFEGVNLTENQIMTTPDNLNMLNTSPLMNQTQVSCLSQIQNNYISCSKLRIINSRKRRKFSKAKKNSLSKMNASKIFDAAKLNEFLQNPLKIEGNIGVNSYKETSMSGSSSRAGRK